MFIKLPAYVSVVDRGLAIEVNANLSKYLLETHACCLINIHGPC